MYPSRSRVGLAMAGICLAFCTSCNQPPQKHALGNLPGQTMSDLEPKVNATTYFAHGHLLERQGQFERAVVQYRKAVALQGDFLSAHNRLGITLNKLGQHAEATAQFRQAIASHPGLAYLYNNLGFSLFLEDKYAEAQVALEQALSLKPDFPRAHLNHALVLARLKRFDGAFSELMQVGSEADACLNMGILLTEAEQYADAARYLESALALRPDFDAAQQQLREVSRLAAESEARQAARLALAAQTTAENVSTDSAAVGAGSESATPGIVSDPVTIAEENVESGVTTPQLIEPVFLDGAEGTAPDSTEAAAEDGADAGTEPVPPEEQEAAADGATMQPMVPMAADAVIEHAMSEAGPVLAADVIVPESERSEGGSAPPAAAIEAAGPGWAQGPGLDPEVLFVLINDALAALKNQSADFGTLWYQGAYDLFPETTPDGLVIDPDAATKAPGAVPENTPED